MVTYNCKQKNRLSLSVNYIFFINGIDSKVVAPCVCMFEQSCPTHTNSGKSEKSIIVVRTPPKWMVSSRGSGVWASLVGGLRMITIEMKYENTPFWPWIWRFGVVVLGTGPWKHRVVLKIEALTYTHPAENFKDRYSDGYLSFYVSQNEVYRVQRPIIGGKSSAGKRRGLQIADFRVKNGFKLENCTTCPSRWIDFYTLYLAVGTFWPTINYPQNQLRGRR